MLKKNKIFPIILMCFIASSCSEEREDDEQKLGYLESVLRESKCEPQYDEKNPNKAIAYQIVNYFDFVNTVSGEVARSYTTLANFVLDCSEEGQKHVRTHECDPEQTPGVVSKCTDDKTVSKSKCLKYIDGKHYLFDNYEEKCDLICDEYCGCVELGKDCTYSVQVSRVKGCIDEHTAYSLVPDMNYPYKDDRAARNMSFKCQDDAFCFKGNCIQKIPCTKEGEKIKDIYLSNEAALYAPGVCTKVGSDMYYQPGDSAELVISDDLSHLYYKDNQLLEPSEACKNNLQTRCENNQAINCNAGIAKIKNCDLSFKHCSVSEDGTAECEYPCMPSDDNTKPFPQCDYESTPNGSCHLTCMPGATTNYSGYFWHKSDCVKCGDNEHCDYSTSKCLPNAD